MTSHYIVERRLDGLLDKPCLGTSQRTSDAAIERVPVLTLKTKPKATTHWSSLAIATECRVSQSTLSRIWQAFGLQPHRTETSKLSQDPLVIEKVQNIVGFSLHPPDSAPMVCIYEKTQIQALDRTGPLLPTRPGQAELRTHAY